ncbi:MAG: Calx-beta domain-containing protein, partial [Cyanobacteria bacterium P01_H01_bin.130]
EVGIDRIGLPFGSAIDDVEAVTLQNDLGAVVSTEIRLVSSGATLAVLPGIESDRLTSHDFVVAETLEFGAAEFQVREDGVPLTAVTVTRSFPELSRLTTTFSFDLLVSRAGGTETDVAAEQLRIAVLGGDRNLTVALPLIDDEIPEPDEVFSLQLLEDPERLQLGEQSTALVTVVDDDSLAPPIAPGGTVGFATSVVRVNEDDGTAELAVLRSGGSQGAVSAVVTVTGGTAIAGSDFVAAPEPATVTFADGELTATIVTIPLLDDQLQEDLESFTVTLSDPIGGATLGTSEVRVEIVDQDALPAGLVEFSEPSFSVVEGVSLVTVPVVRTDGSNGRVTVNVAVIGGTAVEGEDFRSPPGPIGLVFEDGETGPKDITFAIADDALVEGPESFALTLFNPVGGVALGANQSTTIVVEDNDRPAIAVDFAAA